ncbi:PACE efflux transporter [Donghicola mangrovi]|uniref:PACE efflux transporter n=1 Tax=Donghicola mangrovi TaxID=2729614 RepID=A0A850Q2S9_9RHOB|nr:PACE efflux transporter [Donghicola mangrovi]NVO23274.1 PACE efflux transporter [Donghicola mangrovi]
MRSTSDRIRHALSFEILALLLVIPLGAAVFDMPMDHIGVVSVVSAVIAMVWNFVYNHMFDRALQRLTGTTLKRPWVRVLHACLFEAGLLTVLMPFIAWYLDVGLWQATLMDMSFSAFYVVYAFFFNWGYDRLFPLAEWASEDGSSGGQ